MDAGCEAACEAVAEATAWSGDVVKFSLVDCVRATATETNVTRKNRERLMPVYNGDCGSASQAEKEDRAKALTFFK